MKNKIWICLFMLIITACGGGGEPGTEEPIISKDRIDVRPNLTLLGDGQEAELRITANCNWTITNSESWLTVNPASGNGTETVKVIAGKNSTGAERNAILTVRGGSAPNMTVVVTQPKGTDEPVAKTLSANTSSLSFEAKGEQKSFTISSNTNWEISKPEWCTLSVTSGTGDATISVTATENKEREQRTGNIVITGEGVSPITISLSQKAREAGNSEPGPGDNTPPT